MNEDAMWTAGIVILLLAFLAAVVWDASTCIEWGPEHEYTYFIHSGDTLIPMTGRKRDCVRREAAKKEGE
jgi:hypothetical protein